MKKCIKDPGGHKNTDPGGGGWDNAEEPGQDGKWFLIRQGRYITNA